MNGQQGGDPKKLAAGAGDALRLRDAAAAFHRRRGCDEGVEQNLATIQAQIDANRELSASLSFDA